MGRHAHLAGGQAEETKCGPSSFSYHHGTHRFSRKLEKCRPRQTLAKILTVVVHSGPRTKPTVKATKSTGGVVVVRTASVTTIARLADLLPAGGRHENENDPRRGGHFLFFCGGCQRRFCTRVNGMAGPCARFLDGCPIREGGGQSGGAAWCAPWTPIRLLHSPPHWDTSIPSRGQAIPRHRTVRNSTRQCSSNVYIDNYWCCITANFEVHAQVPGQRPWYAEADRLKK